jgi:hypothetical protein
MTDFNNNPKTQPYSADEAADAARAVRGASSRFDGTGKTILSAIGAVDSAREHWLNDPLAAEAFAREHDTTLEEMLIHLDLTKASEVEHAKRVGDDAVVILHPGSPAVDPEREIDFPA